MDAPSRLFDSDRFENDVRNAVARDVDVVVVVVVHVLGLSVVRQPSRLIDHEHEHDHDHVHVAR